MVDVYRTPEVEKQYKRIFKDSAKRFGLATARETRQQIIEAEKKLARETANIRRDPKHHSERFEYVSVKNSQKIFFERIGDDIVIVAAGYSGRKWKDRLEEMEAHIDRQIALAHRVQTCGRSRDDDEGNER